jgi:hypothetical protein
MNRSAVFGLNFLTAPGGGGASIVGDYDPRSQTWGGIVTAAAGPPGNNGSGSNQTCTSTCLNCCPQTSYTSLVPTNVLTQGGSQVATANPDNSMDLGTDDQPDSSTEGDVELD